MADLQIVPSSGAGRAGRAGRSANLSLEEERREVLESVMGALSSGLPDADEMAACSYLLQHLASIVGSHAACSPWQSGS